MLTQLKDIFIEEGNIYMAMDYMSCDLAKIIDDPKVTITEEDIVHIFRQVLQGLEHLHKNWVLHRVVTTHPGHETAQYSRLQTWRLQNYRLWLGSVLWYSR